MEKISFGKDEQVSSISLSYDEASDRRLSKVSEVVGPGELKRLFHYVNIDASDSMYENYPGNELRVKPFISTIEDSLGKESGVQNLQDGKYVALVDANSNTLFIERNEYLKPVTIYEANGNIKTQFYDDYGNVIKKVNGLNEATFFEYNEFNQSTAIIHPDGSEELKIYNEYGFLVSKQGKDGRQFEYEYYWDGKLKRSIDNSGLSTYYFYDDRDNLITVSNDYGLVQSRTYDADGRLVKQWGRSGLTNELFYNEDSQQIMTVQNGQITNHSSYNAFGLVSEIIDALGNKTSFEYNDSLQKTRTTYPDSSFELSEYDSEQQLVSKQSRQKVLTQYEYDANGNRVLAIHADGGRVSYTYNTINKVESMTDALGNTTYYEYDILGRKIRVTYADGNSMTYSYQAGDCQCQSADGKIETVTDALGQETTYFYDLNGKKVKTIFPDGTSISNAYNEQGSLIFSVDGNGYIRERIYSAENKLLTNISVDGRVSTYTYDDEGNLSGASFPDGKSVSYVYDSFNRKIKDQYSDGRVIDYTYDSLGRLNSIKRNNGFEEYYFYDKLGRKVSSSNYLGAVYYTVYDEMGRVIKTINPNGAIFENTYSNGQLVKSTDAMGNTTHYLYDSMGRRNQVVNALGYSETFIYDLNGNLVERIDRNNHKNTYYFDSRNQKIREIDALGNAIDFEYDALGRKIAVINQRGHRREYQYNSRNKVSAIINPSGKTTQYNYDPNGRLLSKIEADGSETTFVYDAAGRLMETYYNDELKIEADYDLNGLQTNISGENSDFFMQFDEYGRKTNIGNREVGENFTFRHDASGNKTARIDSEGRETLYHYDYMSRLTNILTVEGESISFAYDLLGRRIRRENPNGTSVQYSYEKNQLKSIVHLKASGETLLQYNYRYDPAGNILSVDSDKSFTRYSYTARHQLESVMVFNKCYKIDGPCLPIANTESYQYDASGNMVYKRINWITTYMTYDEDDKIISDSFFTYNYDALGRLVSKQSKLNSETLNHYSYNWQSRATNIISVTKSLNKVQRAQNHFAFDVLGRRVYKSSQVVTETFSSSGNFPFLSSLFNPPVSHFSTNSSASFVHYDGDNAYAEYSPDGHLQSRFTFGQGIDEALLLHRSSQENPTEIETFVYHQNHLGSVMGLSDEVGILQNSYEYTAYGQRRKSSSEQVEQPYSYTGREHIGASGRSSLYYYRSRVYDSRRGRFNREDDYFKDLAVQGVGCKAFGELNWYGYAKGNPSKFIDPMGFSAVHCSQFDDGLDPPDSDYTVPVKGDDGNWWSFNYKTDSWVFTIGGCNGNTWVNCGSDPLCGPVGNPDLVQDNNGWSFWCLCGSQYPNGGYLIDEVWAQVRYSDQSGNLIYYPSNNVLQNRCDNKCAFARSLETPPEDPDPYEGCQTTTSYYTEEINRNDWDLSSATTYTESSYSYGYDGYWRYDIEYRDVWGGTSVNYETSRVETRSGCVNSSLNYTHTFFEGSYWEEDPYSAWEDVYIENITDTYFSYDDPTYVISGLDYLF